MIALIGCGKSKRPERCEARDLYTGPLFADARTYAETCAEEWYILSARYGLVFPDDRIEPYDRTIGDLSPIDRAAWYLGVASALVDRMPDETPVGEVKIEVHAGEPYAAPLIEVLRAIGFRPAWPVRTLGIGERRAWYREAVRRHALGLRAA